MGKLGDDLINALLRAEPNADELEGILLRLNKLERLAGIAAKVTKGRTLSELTVGPIRMDFSGLHLLPDDIILINKAGISILAGTSLDNARAYKFVNATDTLGGLYGFDDGSKYTLQLTGLEIAGRDNDVLIYARAPNASTAQLVLKAIEVGADPDPEIILKAADGTASIVFNEDGVDCDIRMESDNSAHMFFLDSGNNRLGIAKETPTTTLHVGGSANVDGAFYANLIGEDYDCRISGDNDANLFYTDAGNDRVGIGTATPAQKLDVNGITLLRDKLAFTQTDLNEYIDSLADGYLDLGATTAVRIKPVMIAEDAIYFTQTDGNEKIDSLADGYMDYRATTAHRFGDGTNATEISNTGDVTFTGTGGLRYGSLYYHGAGSSIVVALQDTWYQFVGFDTNGESNGMTPVKGEDHILVSKAGDYQISLNLATRCVSTTDWEISVWVNNGATQKIPVDIHVTTIAGLKAVHASVTDIVNLAANDTLEMWVQRTDGGGVSKTLTFDHASISAVMVGGGA